MTSKDHSGVQTTVLSLCTVSAVHNIFVSYFFFISQRLFNYFIIFKKLIHKLREVPCSERSTVYILSAILLFALTETNDYKMKLKVQICICEEY